MGALLTLSSGAALLTGNTRSASAIMYWVGFFGGLALLYKAFTMKAQPGGSKVIDPTQSAQMADPVPALQTGPAMGLPTTPLVAGAAPTAPAPSAFPPSQLDWQGRGYAAEGLFEVGKQWALLYDKTKDPAHRREALAAMSAAANLKKSAAKVSYFDSFGSLMGDPDFTQ